MVDLRRNERAPVRVIAEVRAIGNPWERAILEDLSWNGFRMEWKPRYPIDSVISVRFPELEILRARVCWRDENHIGCEFTKALHQYVFEHIARKFAP